MLEARLLGAEEGVQGGSGRKPKAKCAWFILGTFPGPVPYPQKQKDIFLFFFFCILLPPDCVNSIVQTRNQA